jgi:hypothetical protein
MLFRLSSGFRGLISTDTEVGIIFLPQPSYVKTERKRPLRRPRRRWEDVIRMDLRETGWESVEWNQLAQDRDR